MKYGYKEIRKIEASKIRNLCIEKDWFTCGDNDQYGELLDYGFSGKNITSDELVEMATLIKEYSDTDYEVTSIMYELAKICYSYFEEI